MCDDAYQPDPDKERWTYGSKRGADTAHTLAGHLTIPSSDAGLRRRQTLRTIVAVDSERNIVERAVAIAIAIAIAVADADWHIAQLAPRQVVMEACGAS
ncbi:MAG: hypothetical protein ABSF86_13210 [Steroidobacteraceae bacterium]